MLIQQICLKCKGKGFKDNSRIVNGAAPKMCMLCKGAGYKSATGALEPTAALPGSTEKMNAMRFRADNNIPLHNLKDAEGYGGTLRQDRLKGGNSR